MYCKGGAETHWKVLNVILKKLQLVQKKVACLRKKLNVSGWDLDSKFLKAVKGATLSNLFTSCAAFAD